MKTTIKNKMSLRKYFLLFVLLLGFIKADAYFLAGEITWTCIGKDSFIIQLMVYRDCNDFKFTGTVAVPVKCISSGQVITTLNISQPTPVDITPTCGSTSTRCQDSLSSFPYGIEQYSFQKLLIIPSSASCCELELSFSGCCRNKGVTNLYPSQPFYLSGELNRCLSPGDNAPRFTNPPVAIICNNQDFIFSHGIIDVDIDSNGGMIDSIAFEFTSPLVNSTTPVQYDTPYTYNKPLKFYGFPDDKQHFPKGISLDRATGDIQFRPINTGSTLTAIKLSEWRKVNGKMTKIGELTREMYIIVVQCPENHAPILSGPFFKSVYAGETVNFSISTDDIDTQDTLLIGWNGAIPNASFSSNNKQVKHPTGDFSWTTKKTDARSIPYIFTLIVIDDACPVRLKDTRAYQILVWDSNTIGLKGKTFAKNSFEIMPNPADESFIIRSLSVDKTINSVSIYNSFGQKCREINSINKESILIEKENLPAGVYLLLVRDSEHEVYLMKLMLK